MAVPAKKPENQSQLGANGRIPRLNGLQHVAVRLYAEGKTRSTVAQLLGPRLYRDMDEEDAVKAMRKKLRSWEETQWFRDAVYDYAIVQTDMDIPRIMAGVRSRARRGRVDAARLALEVTGRHNPRGQENAPAVVQISFGGAVPRPDSRVEVGEAQLYGRQELPPIDGEVIEEAEIVPEIPSNKPDGRKGLRRRLGLS
jgi:hypothetical protein